VLGFVVFGMHLMHADLRLGAVFNVISEKLKLDIAAFQARHASLEWVQTTNLVESSSFLAVPKENS